MNWFKRTICGNVYHEYRKDQDSFGTQLFSIEKSISGKITLYDQRPMRSGKASKMYLFTTIREAKKIALQSIKDPKILKPYLDTEWYEFQKHSTQVIANAEKLIKKLTS